MNFDLIVIGSGPGGYVAAIRAAQLGMSVAIVERESLGGICLNWGCIPTKALLKSAQVFQYLQHASDYGLEILGQAKANFEAVIKRSRGVADKMSKGVQFLMRKNKITVLQGEGRLSPNKKVLVKDAQAKTTEYSAKNIIIATGARARELPNLALNGKNIIGYREAMTLAQQPKHLVVVGSGAIGVEFAYFYNALGSKVTIIEYLDQILPREDLDVSKEMQKIFKKSGIEIKTGHAVQRVENLGQNCRVWIKNNKTGKEESLEADVVLSATGISPNTENLGLEALNIKKNTAGFIEVDKNYQTNVPNIYAIGDVIPTAALAHVASAEGILCVEHLAGHKTEALDYGNIPSCTYCWPEVASVGHTETQAKEAGYEILVGKFPFSASGKASASGSNEGFVKVIFDKKYGELLGCHMVGANVTEMIAEIVAARKLETTGHEILKAVHPHPTMSEAVMEATADAYGEVIHL